MVVGLKYQALNLLITGELFLKRPGESDIQNHDSAHKKRILLLHLNGFFSFSSVHGRFKKSTTFKLIIHTSIKLIMCKRQRENKKLPSIRQKYKEARLIT